MTRVAGVFLLAAASFADNPEGVKESVTYATSWEAAVEEAASCNVPIVVHRHGFY
ncbi:MAG: hypothetical protein ACREID_06480 [Planctomycetota bacterium]